MIVSINVAGDVAIEDLDNFRGFKVVAACGVDALAQAMSGLGRLDAEGAAWISRPWLLAHGRPQDANWLAGFNAMHEYASAHGWVDMATESLRAHIEYKPS